MFTLAYLFLLPAILSLGLFKYYPFITGFIKSFYNWNGANLNNFIGLENYINLFKDPIFYTSFSNIIIISLGFVIGQITFPLIAAVCVFHLRNKRIQRIYKVLFVVPMIVPYIIIFLLWRWIYVGNYGMLNEGLRAVGLESWTRDWLGETQTALASIVFVNFPWIGTISFLIFLAGLIAISEELFDAGKMDGMNIWQRFTQLELPLIRNQIRLVIILSMIQTFQSFENVLILTNGGPGYSTITPALYLYKAGFEYNKLGYASAIGVTVLVFLLLFTVLTNKMFKPTDKLN